LEKTREIVRFSFLFRGSLVQEELNFIVLITKVEQLYNYMELTESPKGLLYNKIGERMYRSNSPGGKLFKQDILYSAGSK
jgi:hypothetical protein